MAPLLEVREVSFKYPQALILNRISFSIDRERYFACWDLMAAAKPHC